MDEIDSHSIVKDVDLNSPEFNNDEYEELRNTIRENKTSLPDMQLKDNFVYKRVKFRTGTESEEDSLWRLWLPRVLGRSVIENVHNISGCHGG